MSAAPPRTDLNPRVLFLCPQPFFAWRGSPIRVAYDVEAIALLGYQVDLLTLPIGEPRDIPGVRILRVLRLPGLRNIPIGPSPGKLLYDALLFGRGLYEVLRRPYAVIHGVEETGLIACILGRLCGAAVVFEKHSDPASHRAGLLKNLVLKAYARVERLMIAGADAVIGTGTTLVRQVQQVNPRVSAHHVFDLPSSKVEADDTKAAAIRAQWQRRPDEILALYVGSFAVYQGVDLLFEAMADAFQKNPRLRLVVIGGSPAEREERTRWLAARGLAERVTFAGFIPPDELPHHLRAADILLSPRISGVNSPLKMLDYLKIARPIVATDLAANRELVDTTNALLVPAEARAFAAGVLQLADDPALCARLATAGRLLIDQRYNFDRFVDRLRACYAGLPPPRLRGLRLAFAGSGFIALIGLLAFGLMTH